MMKLAGVVCVLGLMALAFDAEAQHTIYKCAQGDKIAYSNEPCPNAKKVEIKQTKGVNYEGRSGGGSPKR